MSGEFGCVIGVLSVLAERNKYPKAVVHVGCKDGSILRACFEFYNRIHFGLEKTIYIGLDENEQAARQASEKFEGYASFMFKCAAVKNYKLVMKIPELEFIDSADILHLITVPANMPADFLQKILSAIEDGILVFPEPARTLNDYEPFLAKNGFTRFVNNNMVCCLRTESVSVPILSPSENCTPKPLVTRMSSSSSFPDTSSDIMDVDWFYEEIWRNNTNNYKKDIQVSISEQYLNDLSKSFPSSSGHSDQQDEQSFEKLCLNHIFKTCKQLGFERILYEPKSLSELCTSAGISPRHLNLISHFLGILEQQSYLSFNKSNDTYVLAGSFPPNDQLQAQMEECTDSLFRNTSDSECMLSLCNRCGYDLPFILTGEKEPMKLMYPSARENESNADLAYADSPEIKHRNEVLQKLMSEFKYKEGPIQIIEIGGGSATTTESILHILNKASISYEYTFTDFSSGYFSSAKNKLPSQEFLKYELLNIEVDPKSQGFVPYSWDIVIGANVLHQVKNARQVLMNIRQLLKTDGYFLMAERTAPSLVLDLTFGLLDSWWRFKGVDQDRTCYPLLNTEEWTHLLNLSDFKCLASINYPESIIVAQAKLNKLISSYPWLIISNNVEYSNALESELGNNVLKYQLDTAQQTNSIRDEILSNLITSPTLNGIIFIALYTKKEPNLNEMTITSELIQLLSTKLSQKEILTKFLLVTNGSINTLGDEYHPFQALLLGGAATISESHSQINCTTVILDSNESCEIHSEYIFQEIWKSDKEFRVALSKKKRFLPRLVRREPRSEEQPAISSEKKLKSHLTYMLYYPANSAQALCCEVVRWLWQNGVRQLCLISESDDDGSTWPQLKQNKWTQLIFYKCAIYEDNCLSQITALMKKDGLPPLGGVFAVGYNSNQNQAPSILFNWVKSVWNLHKLTCSVNLVHFTLFVPIHPPIKIVNGMTLFASSLVKYRSRQGLHGKCINWDVEALIAHESKNISFLLTTTILTMYDCRNPIFICLFDWSQYRMSEAWSSELRLSQRNSVSYFEATVGKSQEEKVTHAMEIIVELLCDVTGLVPTDVDISNSFQEIGLDSLMIVELHNKLEATFDFDFTATALFSHSTPKELAKYMVNELLGMDTRKDSRRQSSWMTFGEDIAVVGMSCRIGNATTPSEFWNSLVNGEECFREIPQNRFDYTKYYNPNSQGHMYTKYGSFINNVDGFDCNFFEISPTEAELMDPQQRLLLQLTWEALEDAGIPPDSLKETKTGVFVGICSHDYEETVIMPKTSVGSYFATSNLASIASGRISYFLGTQGPSMSVDTACSSSMVAVHLACQSLRLQESSMVIVGGVQLILSPNTYINYCHAKMLSPGRHLKAFDVDADGFVRGEGCTVLVLKKLSDAALNGDNILALIKGSSVSHGGSSAGLTVPNGAAQEILIKRTLRQCSITPNDIDYLETHGTGTALGDPIEVNALENVFNKDGTRLNPLFIGSVKANVGHLEGAAGITGLLKTILAIRAKTIPPQISFKTINPHIVNPGFFKISTAPEPWPSIGGKPRMGGVSSFGVGGTNAHVVVEEAPIEYLQLAPSKSPGIPYVFTISAKSKPALDQLISAYKHKIEELQNGHEDYLSDMAYASNVGRSHFKYRIAIVARDRAELLQQLKTNSFCTRSPPIEKPTKVCFLFTGQGSHYFGMGKELYRTQPAFQTCLDRCSDIFEEILGKSLLDVLFNDKQMLEDTRYSQPAVFSIEYSLACLWISLGVQPAYLLGHSLGEYAAACVGGVLTLKDALQLLISRASLVHSMATVGEWKMLALRENLPTVQALARNLNCWNSIDISCLNGPEQTVISGPVEVLNLLKAASKTSSVLLNVPYAFHSRQIQPILVTFKQCLEKTQFSTATIPIISSLTGDKLSDMEMDVEYWLRHCVEPVNFTKAMETAQTFGCGIFIEVGPGPVLCNLARKWIADTAEVQYDWLNSINTGQSNWNSMLTTLAKLYVRGFNFHFSELYGEKKQKVELPLYPFQDIKCWGKRTVDLGLTSQFLPGEESIPNHSLLGKFVCHSSKNTIFENCINIEDQSYKYLTGHAFLGDIMFPGAGFVELALQGGKALREEAVCVELTQISFECPLVLNAAEVKLIQTVLSSNTNRELANSFEICSSGGREQGWLSHATGIVTSTCAEEKEVAIDIYDLKSKLQRRNPADLYRHFSNTDGVEYLNCFERITKLWVGQTEALSEIELSEDISVQNYICHPIILDNAFQTLFSIHIMNGNQGIQQAHILAGMDTVKAYLQDFPNRRVYVYAKASKLSGNSVTGDIKIFTACGRPLLQIFGYRTVVVSSFSASIKQTTTNDKPLYQEIWLKDKTASQKFATTENDADFIRHDSPAPFLVISDEKNELIKQLVSKLEPYKKKVILLTLNNQTLLTPGLLEATLAPNSNLHSVIYTLGLSNQFQNYPNQLAMRQENLELYMRRSTEGLLVLAKLLIRNNIGIANKFLVITKGCSGQGLKNQESFSTPFDSMIWGAVKTVHTEYPELNAVCLDLDQMEPLARQIDQVFKEIYMPRDGEVQLAYMGRPNSRYVRRVVPYKNPNDLVEFKCKPNRTYLITGGLGGVGLEMAYWLAKKGATHLALLGRSNPQQHVLTKIVALQEKCEATVIICDVGNQSELKDVMADITPPLAGILHAAGTIHDAAILNQNWSTLSHVFRAKVLGAWNLHLLSLDYKLDHFVLCSSVASLIGSAGQYNYAAGNAFQDALAHYRVGKGLVGLSINWGAWSEVGIALGKKLAPGIQSFSPEFALKYLSSVMHDKVPQLCISKFDWDAYWEHHQEDRWSSEIYKTQRTTPASPKPARIEPALLHTFASMKQLVKLVVSKITGHTEVSETAIFHQLGLDSIMIIELRNKIQDLSGIQVPMTAIFDFPNVEQLSKQLLTLKPTKTNENRIEMESLEVDSIPTTSTNNYKLKPSQTPVQSTRSHVFDSNPTQSTPVPFINHYEPLSNVFPTSTTNLVLPIQTEEQNVAPKQIAEQRNEHDVAVVGMSCRFGCAASIEEYWNLLCDGKDTISEIPPSRFNYKKYYDPDNSKDGVKHKMYTKHGSFVPNVDQFDYEFFEISEKDAQLMDPQQRLLLECSWEALENAGIQPGKLSEIKAGVHIGMSSNDYGLLLERNGVVDSTIETHPLAYIIGNIASTASGRLSHFLNLQGPCLTVDTACSSALVAINLAVQSLRSGESDVNIVGGVSLIFVPDKFLHYCRASMLSKDGYCKAFDESADGYCRGEGVGVVILKRLADALKDNDNILAVVKGSAVAHCGIGSGLGVPSGPAQIKLLKEAILNSGLVGHEVDFVETHGSGTLLGDAIEVNSLDRVYGERKSKDNPMIIGSVKANIGHTEGAAGMAGFIKVVLSLHHGRIPPQPHFRLNHLNPHIKNPSFIQIPEMQGTSWPNKSSMTAGVTSIGYGGTIAHVILQRLENKHPSKLQHKPKLLSTAFLFIFSAKTRTALCNLLSTYLMKPWVAEDLPNLAYSTTITRTHFVYRAAVVASSPDAFKSKIKAQLQNLQHVQCYSKANVGFYFSPIHLNLRQGLGIHLYQNSAYFASCIDNCLIVADQKLVKPLREIIFQTNASYELKGMESNIAQFVLQYCLAMLHMHLGLNPICVSGNGIGEYVAMVVANVLTLKDAVDLIISREKYHMELDLNLKTKKKVSFDAVSDAHVLTSRLNNLGVERSVFKQHNFKTEYGNVLARIMFRAPTLGEVQFIAPDSEEPGMDFAGKFWSEIQNSSWNPAGGEHSTSRFKELGCEMVLNFGDGLRLSSENEYVTNVWCFNWPASEPEINEWTIFIGQLAHLYSMGLNLNLNLLYPTAQYKKISLPNYPFEKKKVWFEENSANLVTGPTSK